ncbi:hypothetical protein [Salinibacterium sp. ZJ450]|uniref:hypothetical protein n=1 Tax=Salinibacterium sp. ZJ450 TaxID=2708338 RepID=UPI001420FF95|nr:hypothetical protein [Salinibacterium sp. ZJ450]
MRIADHRTVRYERTLRARISAAALALNVDLAGADSLEEEIARLLRSRELSDIWFVIATLTTVFPESAVVLEVSRSMRSNDENAAVESVIAELRELTAEQWARHPLVVEHETIVDTHFTSAGHTFGDSRAIVDALSRAVVIAGGQHAVWSSDLTALMPMTHGVAQRHYALIPRHCHYVLPDLCDEPDRAARLMSLAAHSGNSTTSVGYGLGPLVAIDSFPSPSDEDGARRYNWHLAAVRTMDRVVAVSQTAAREYAGWKLMLEGLGVQGPEVSVIAAPKQPCSWGPTRPLVWALGENAAFGDYPTVVSAADLLSSEGRMVDVRFVEANDPQDLLRRPDAVVVMAPYLTHSALLAGAAEAGVPVVAARSGFAAELAETVPVTIVEPHSVEELVSALADVLGEALVVSTATTDQYRAADAYAREFFASVGWTARV